MLNSIDLWINQQEKFAERTPREVPCQSISCLKSLNLGIE